MIYDGIEYFPVTDDPEALSRLRQRENVDSQKLGDFACSLGLHPPNHTDSVALVDYAHSLGLYPPGYPEVDCNLTKRACCFACSSAALA